MADALTLDVLVRVAERSVLHPFFAFWIPIFAFAQGHELDSGVVLASAIFFLATFTRFVVSYTSVIWRNRSWRAGLAGLLRQPRTAWSDEVVVITGGAQGLGAVLAETLAMLHATVVVLDINESLPAFGDVHFFRCDVSKPEELAETFKTIREEVGDPTVLVNNAGIVNGKSVTELSPDELRRTFAVNVEAHFLAVRECLPAMLKKGEGHIVTVASVLGFSGISKLTDYAASKAALLAFHDSLYYELRYHHSENSIRTSLVCPGQLTTTLFGSLDKHHNLVGSFITPLIEPFELVKEIIGALEARESRTICVPFYSSFAWLIRGLPSWLQDLAQWVTGSSAMMEHFERAGGSDVGASLKKE